MTGAASTEERPQLFPGRVSPIRDEIFRFHLEQTARNKVKQVEARLRSEATRRQPESADRGTSLPPSSGGRGTRRSRSLEAARSSENTTPPTLRARRAREPELAYAAATVTEDCILEEVYEEYGPRRWAPIDERQKTQSAPRGGFEGPTREEARTEDRQQWQPEEEEEVAPPCHTPLMSAQLPRG